MIGSSALNHQERAINSSARRTASYEPIPSTNSECLLPSLRVNTTSHHVSVEESSLLNIFLSLQGKSDDKTCACRGFNPHVAPVMEHSLAGKREPQSQAVVLA